MHLTRSSSAQSSFACPWPSLEFQFSFYCTGTLTELQNKNKTDAHILSRTEALGYERAEVAGWFVETHVVVQFCSGCPLDNGCDGPWPMSKFLLFRPHAEHTIVKCTVRNPLA